MSSKIYYFSGTGNSLAVSKQLEEALSEKGCIVPLGIFENKESIEVDTDVLGFVFPVYYMNVPDVVKSFVKKLNFKTNPYIFAIATCNGSPGQSLFTLNKYLRTKGKELSSGFVIDMPGNLLVTPPGIEVKRLKNSKNKVSEIASYINNKSTNKFEGKDNFKIHMESFVLATFEKNFHVSPKKFLSNSDCIGCGVCEKVCPVKNIKVVDKKPQWGNKCARCLACFHWCPKKAVVINRFLKKRNRYHHPEVSLMDMDLRNRFRSIY